MTAHTVLSEGHVFPGGKVLIPRWSVWCAAVALSACEGNIVGSTSTTKDLPGDPMIATQCGDEYRPGHTMIHRLTNVEYDNTVRDLLFVPSTHGTTFASSSVGSTGFTNQSEVLTLSDQQVVDYFKAAESLANEVAATRTTANAAWSKLTSSCATTATPTDTCVQSLVRDLAERGFRRPVDADDVTALMAVYKGETTFVDGFRDVIIAVLVDPRFIFNHIKHPSPDDPKVAIAIDDYELAMRLSYFLWQSMPDEGLRSLASEGRLHEQASLETEVKRMLADPKAKSFATQFRRDWARLSLLDSANGYGGLDATTTGNLRQESQLLMEDILASDSSLLTLATADSTFVNQGLADYYGWSTAGLGAQFQKTKIPVGERRGMLTTGAVMLTSGGGATYTHPVQRGRWVMDSYLCSPPPPPPADVMAALPNTSSDLPMRDRLAEHTASARCSGCHKLMDAYGLGLENFDMSGKWRTTYAALQNRTIDASGALPDGRTFAGPAEMVGVIGADPKVPACLTEKLMGFALAREMRGTDDHCVAQTLGAKYVLPGSTLSGLVTRIAMSRQFQAQEGAAQ